MPLPLRLTLGLLLVITGAALLAVAVLGARSRLPRNRFAGVRTAATLRSDAAFALANRAAAAPTGAAGLVGVVGGGAVAAGGGVAGWVVLAVTVPGLLVLAGLGGMLGDRASAALVPTATPAAPACGGSCAGCDLVAGCQDRGSVEPAAPNAGP